MQLNDWKSRGFEFAMGFYIMIMVVNYVAGDEVFTWKKPIGGLIVALITGYIWQGGMKVAVGKRFKTHHRFNLWQFTLETTGATILAILLISLIFWDPVSIKKLFLSFGVALVVSVILGYTMQLLIFGRKEKAV